MKLPDAYHAFSKLEALRRLNRSRRHERALKDSLTKLAKWYDAEPNSPEAEAAFQAWLHSPLPSW